MMMGFVFSYYAFFLVSDDLITLATYSLNASFYQRRRNSLYRTFLFHLQASFAAKRGSVRSLALASSPRSLGGKSPLPQHCIYLDMFLLSVY